MPRKKALKKIIVFLFCVILCIALTAVLYTRLYTGDRLTIDLYVTVDGEAGTIENAGEKYDLIDKKDHCVLKERANEYGPYDFSLIIVYGNNKSIPLTLKYYHYNWWEIIKSNLYIDINTENNSYTIREEYKYTPDSFLCHFKKVAESSETINGFNTIETYIGSP